MLSAAKQFFRRVFPDKSLIDFPSGYIHNRRIMENLPHCGKKLVVGDYTLRDFMEISKAGHDVYLMDIVDCPSIEKSRFFHQSITERTSFSNGAFSCVVMAEVIEHLIEDYKALCEVNRLLEEHGRLLITIPYLNDAPEFHVRVHTLNSIRRLLSASGFVMLDHKYRGGLIYTNTFMMSLFFLLLFPFFGRNAIKRGNGLIYKLAMSLGNVKFFKRFSSAYGGIIVAQKVRPPNVTDNLAVQIKAFGQDA